MTSSTPTQTHSPSSHFSRPLFHIPAPSFKLILSLLDFSPPFCPPPPPPTLQSRAFGCQWDQATARCMSMEKNGWLIQSSLLFLRQCRVISSTAKAFWCIAFMLSLAPPPSLPHSLTPHSHRNQSCCGLRGRETSFTESSETREGLFQRGDTQQWAVYLHHKEAAVTAVRTRVSGVNIMCKQGVNHISLRLARKITSKQHQTMNRIF